MSKQHYLLDWFGRNLEHYTLYPLPDDRRAGKDCSRVGMTLESGEVLIFEFDFVPPLFPEDCRNERADYYRRLHEQHYGKTCISV